MAITLPCLTKRHVCILALHFGTDLVFPSYSFFWARQAIHYFSPRSHTTQAVAMTHSTRSQEVTDAANDNASVSQSLHRRQEGGIDGQYEHIYRRTGHNQVPNHSAQAVRDLDDDTDQSFEHCLYRHVPSQHSYGRSPSITESGGRIPSSTGSYANVERSETASRSYASDAGFVADVQVCDQTRRTI